MTSLDTFATDYLEITQGCGVLDRSERGKLALTGADAKAFLQGQVTNDVGGLTDGDGCYAAFLTPKGKMLGDLRVLDAGADDHGELLLDTERASLQELFNMIRRFSVGYDVELHKRTLERGMLSLIGPDADAVAGLGQASLGAHEHSHAQISIDSTLVRAIRTDVGVDLLFDAGDADAVRTAIAEAGGVAIGEDAAECLRIERGRPRYGIDIDDSVIPQEAGLNERAVSFTKGCYVGQETVARLFYRGKPNRRLAGLSSPTPLQAGEHLTYDGRAAGRVTSVAISPRFGPIGLALVRREAPDGAIVSLGPLAGAEVVPLPFD